MRGQFSPRSSKVKRSTVRRFLIDPVLLIAALVSAPWWMRKSRGGWGERFGKAQALPAPTEGRKRLLIHAVSVGEINATRPLVDELAEDVDIVVASHTDTGIERARELYADRFPVVRYPLDGSWAVRRFLNAVRPDAVALFEMEMWPNFMDECAKRSVPVCIVNGRLSPRSFKRYRWIRVLARRYFLSLAFAGVQDEAYRDRFVAMGVPEDRCTVAGNTKWDVAPPHTERAAKIAHELGIDPSKPLVVAGSTAPGEDALIRKALPEGVQLLCAPRRNEWWDDAAADLAPCVRRSRPAEGDPAHGRFLLDSMGELDDMYALADVVVVGRSFGELHGSNPMEPAANGKPVVIGPRYSDFKAAVEVLAEQDAIFVTDRKDVKRVLHGLMDDPDRRAEGGERAKRVAAQHRGAAAKYADLVRSMMGLPERGDDDAGA